MLGLYVGVSLALFVLAQRDLFAEMNLRQSQMGELESMQANLRAALQDVSRLSTAYGQLLSWCRVLGVVLRAPFGPAPMARPAPGQLFDGLPRSTQLGVADPGEDQAGDATHAIERRLYALGWLTGRGRTWSKRRPLGCVRNPTCCSGCPASARSPGSTSGPTPWRQAERSPPVPTRCGPASSRCSPKSTVGSPTNSPARC